VRFFVATLAAHPPAAAASSGSMTSTRSNVSKPKPAPPVAQCFTAFRAA
jgi:hypothetical protein